MVAVKIFIQRNILLLCKLFVIIVIGAGLLTATLIPLSKIHYISKNAVAPLQTTELPILTPTPIITLAPTAGPRFLTNITKGPKDSYIITLKTYYTSYDGLQIKTGALPQFIVKALSEDQLVKLADLSEIYDGIKVYPQKNPVFTLYMLSSKARFRHFSNLTKLNNSKSGINIYRFRTSQNPSIWGYTSHYDSAPCFLNINVTETPPCGEGLIDFSKNPSESHLLAFQCEAKTSAGVKACDEIVRNIEEVKAV